ncbi:MAG: alpha/beta fold hydrolase [Planctomycetes bacterium]|nr:alpha/beta fold hydrolase [Planctomycetota bacterium]
MNITEEHVCFASGKVSLEGVLAYNEDLSPSKAILLCSPHPTLGGDMENNIITNLARVSADAGFISLRFNYRGVGNSECEAKDIAEKFHYWEKTMSSENYTDAVTDACSAFNYLTAQTGRQTMYFIAGYSFGGIIGMRVAAAHGNVQAFASVSTPFGKYDLNFLKGCKKPKLFIYNQNDFATTEEDTLQGLEKIPQPKTIELIENSDHFYRGKEDVVSQKVYNFFNSVSC